MDAPAEANLRAESARANGRSDQARVSSSCASLSLGFWYGPLPVFRPYSLLGMASNVTVPSLAPSIGIALVGRNAVVASRWLCHPLSERILNKESRRSRASEDQAMR
ncbi:unnamed protein product [Cercospora beticola]|nr:unnamed protein product [Cercospora beticola]